MSLVNKDHSFESFCDVNIEISNNLASFKKKYVHGNQVPSTNIDRSKAIVNRSS